MIPSGPPTSAAANLLFSPVMHLLLQRFREDYDMVVIDTPPSLQMPDARVVAREADAVVLVIRAGHTTRDAALATSQRFTEDKTRILGNYPERLEPKRLGKWILRILQGVLRRIVQVLA